MHWPGTRTKCAGGELFLTPRNSLLFVGFLDRRGYRGADDYRTIRIGQRLRVFLPVLSWDRCQGRLLEGTGCQFPRIPLFPPVWYTPLLVSIRDTLDTNEAYSVHTKRPTQGTTLIILDGERKTRKTRTIHTSLLPAPCISKFKDL